MYLLFMKDKDKIYRNNFAWIKMYTLLDYIYG